LLWVAEVSLIVTSANLERVIAWFCRVNTSFWALLMQHTQEEKKRNPPTYIIHQEAR
jgi:hypothetical protein